MSSYHPLDHTTLPLLAEALSRLEGGFASLPHVPQPESASPDRLRAVLGEVADRLRDNFPYFHPLYAGQMLKPPHPVARLAYALAMWINPNNHALDGGRASSAMELETVAALARMFGWDRHLGHLTGGGTMANLEALWVAGQLRPGAAVVASSQAHYTHGRISAVLGLPFHALAADAGGRMDMAALEQVLEREQVGTVVATAGTTGLGAVDPIPALLVLREKYGFRLHVDAAYGGYFGLAGNLGRNTGAAFAALREVDSIVIDPHKHGLQPYGCGSVLFHDPSVGRFYRHDSPYTYFTSADLHLGEISLECSRPGAAAVALWATQRLLPLERRGEFAGMLERCHAAAVALHQRLSVDPRFLAPLSR
jgi:tyrosine decarboxylase/aspartate 1-decarboxylase